MVNEYETERIKASAEFANGSIEAQKSATEDDIRKDPAFTEAYKLVDKYLNPEERQQAPRMVQKKEVKTYPELDSETLANNGMQLVSDVKNAIYTADGGLGLIGSYNKFKDAPKEVKEALWYMWDKYDEADMTWSAFGRGLKSIGKDPSTYTGIGAGIKIFGQKAATNMMVKRFKDMLISGTVGGAYTGGEEFVKQEIQGLEQKDYDAIMQNASIGAIVGTIAPVGIEAAIKGVGAVGKGIASTIQEGEQLMMQQAGGGVPPNEKDLIIQHNLSESNLAHAERMGGLPIPSLAITNKGTPLEGFGDITMLGDEALAKPSKTHKVFGADIYSPRYPTVKNKLSTKAEREISNELTEFEKMTGSDYQGIDFDYIGDNVALKAKYLKEKGIDIPLVNKELDKAKKNEYDAFADIVDKYKLNKEYADDAEIIQRVKDYYIEKGFEANDPLLTDEKKLRRLTIGLIQNVKNTKLQLSEEGKIDPYKTKNAIDEVINKNESEYNDYVSEYLQSKGAKEVIYGGTDNQGRQKWIPHNLDNVIKQLKTDLVGGETNSWSGGTGRLRALFTPQFKTLKQVKEAKNKLVSDSEFEKISGETTQEFFNIGDELEKYYKYTRDFGFNDTVSALIEDSIASPLNKELSSYGFENVPQKLIDRIEGFKFALKEMPTEYFETKMLRKMELGEFKYAIIPDNASDKTKQILEKNGIEYSTYNTKIDQDRLLQIKKIADEKGYAFAMPIGALGLNATQQGSEE